MEWRWSGRKLLARMLAPFSPLTADVCQIIVDKGRVLALQAGELVLDGLKFLIGHVIEVDESGAAPSTPRSNSSSFRRTIRVSRF